MGSIVSIDKYLIVVDRRGTLKSSLIFRNKSNKLDHWFKDNVPEAP